MTAAQVTSYYKNYTLLSEVKYVLFLKQQEPTFQDSF